jgi:hypothetical protein
MSIEMSRCTVSMRLVGVARDYGDHESRKELTRLRVLIDIYRWSAIGRGRLGAAWSWAKTGLPSCSMRHALAARTV